MAFARLIRCRLLFLLMFLSCIFFLQARVAAHGMTRVGENAQNTITKIPVVDGFAYVADATILYKINSTSLALVDSLTLPAGSIFSTTLDSANGFIYLGTNLVGTTCRLYKIRLSDFSNQGFTILTSTNVNGGAIDSQGNGYFLGLRGGLDKVRLSDLTVLISTRITGFPFPTYHEIILDETRGYLYASEYTLGTSIHRIRMDTLAVANSLVRSEPKFTESGIPIMHGRYLYMGNYNLTSPGVLRVDLDDFSTQSYLEFVSSPTAVQVWTATLDSTNGFAYFGTYPDPYSIPSVIYKVRLSDFSEIGSLTLDFADGPLWGRGYDSAPNAIFLSGNKTVRVTVYNVPGGS